jgi:phosphoribosylglycinamide formyltransferase-1
MDSDQSPDVPATPLARDVPIAVFVSGGGRTLKNLDGAIHRGDLPARIVLVVASKECPGAEFARERGYTTVVDGRLDDVATVERLLSDTGARWVVLAGYVRLLPIPERWKGRVVNIHPSLLPRHGGQGMYGQRVHEAVLGAGDAESGCTVHLADGEYDRGEIIAQARCPVYPEDTVQTLASRVFELETELYPKALSKLLRERP